MRDSWLRRKSENTLSWYAQTNVSSGMSKGLGPPPPALLTRIVTFPKASTVAFTSASRAASSVTSQARAMAFPPALRIPSATASAVSFFRSLTATAAPAPAKSSAIPRPIPAPPPVTIATCVRPDRTSPALS